MNAKHMSPTIRGQITIPKDIREKLGINQKSKFKVYIEKNKIILEPVSKIDLLLKDIEEEARIKGYTHEELNQEIEIIREKLMKDLY